MLRGADEHNNSGGRYHSIGNSILSNCTYDVYVDCNIPNGANDKGVFTGCKSKKVVINEGVTTIGDCAFAGSACQNVAIAESVTTICDKAFYKCTALEDIVIPDGVASLGKYAFAETRTLKNITIGKGVTSVGREHFLIASRCKASISPTLRPGAQ